MATTVVNGRRTILCPALPAIQFTGFVSRRTMRRVLSADDLFEVEGDARLLLSAARLEDDDVVDVVKLCKAHMQGEPPMLTRTGPESTRIRVHDRWRVCVRRCVKPERARWLVCHEIAEHHYARLGRDERTEARCDALGAALVVPRRLASLALRKHGDRVASLARALGVQQALAMLRLGEVTDRPVVLARRPGVRLARGGAFQWPEDIGPKLARRVRFSDDGRVGWLAR